MGTGGGNVPYVQHCNDKASGIFSGLFSYVRRLLPVEAEVLMGFPKLWTRISWLGKPESDCPKAPRYKCCGNSMGVNVMEWLGIKINEYLEEKYNEVPKV
jgi:DNA (cytosine-5)-methyltransferase 1